MNTVRSRPVLLPFLALGRPAVVLDTDGDLPAMADPRVGLARGATILAAIGIPVVALTAGGEVTRQHPLGEVGALLLGYALVSVALAKIPWTTLAPAWSMAIPGVQLLFVVSLTSLTGGGSSPYFAFYAPVLALSGWYLRREWVVATVIAAAAVECWRAFVVEGGLGSIEQVTIALPFFAAIAGLAHLTARQLRGAIVTIRRDQIRTAETLTAVRTLAASSSVDPLPAVALAAGRIFGARARAIAFDRSEPTGRDLFAESDGGRRLSLAIAAGSRVHGILELERGIPFSTTEARLAGILAGAAGHAAEARRGAHRRARRRGTAPRAGRSATRVTRSAH
jgi:hypothetical protein